MSLPESRIARPVIKNTYSKRSHIESHESDKENKCDSINEKSSTFLHGLLDTFNDDDNDDFFGDLDMNKSLFGRQHQHDSTKETSPQLISKDVLLAETLAISDGEDNISIAEPPLTPRSKLEAQLKAFDQESPTQLSKASKIRKNPFMLIDDDDEDDADEKESDEAFMNRFRSQFLSSKKSEGQATLESSTKVSRVEPKLSNLSPSPVFEKSPVSNEPESHKPTIAMRSLSPGLAYDDSLFVSANSSPKDDPVEDEADFDASITQKTKDSDNLENEMAEIQPESPEPQKFSSKSGIKKLSAKQLEEMERETQRMRRELQIEPTVHVSKKITPASFLSKFRQSRPKSPVRAVEPIVAVNDSDNHEIMSPKDEHHTPITSPMGSDAEEEFNVGTISKYKPDFAKLLSSPSSGSARNETPAKHTENIKHIEAPVTPNSSKTKKQVKIDLPSSPLDQSSSAKKPNRYTRDVPPWRASYLSKFSNPKGLNKKAKKADSDSDSDLEILPPQPSNALRKLADLAGVKSVVSSKAGTSTKQRQDQDLITSIQAKQREQILMDRAEKEASMKARNLIDEAHKEDEEEVKEELWDQARRSAALIRKREKELEKAQGKVKNEDDDNDEEEAEFKLDVEEVPESDNDSDGDLVVKFYEDEAEENSEDEAEDEAEDIADDADDVEAKKKNDVDELTLFANKDDIQVPSTMEQRESLRSLQDSENEDEEPKFTLKSSTLRRRAHISNDDDDDDEGESQQTSILSAPIPSAFGPFSQSIGSVGDDLSMSQMFQESQALSVKTLDGKDIDGASNLRAAANYFPTQDEEDDMAVIIEPATNENSSGSNAQPTVDVNADDTPVKPRRNSFYHDFDFPPTQLSQFPAPTPMSPIKREPMQDLWSDDSDDEEKESSIVKPGLRRLKQRPETVESLHSKFSDNEDESTQAITQAMAKKNKPRTKVKWDKSKARDIADEEAVESDDEWAGLGGNSDEELDPEVAAELENMVDDTGNANEGAVDLQKLFAQKERSKDEELVNKLLHDVANGGWRKKRTNGSLLDGLSDEDDDEEDRRKSEYRQRRARQEAKRREKLLEANDKLSAMSSNPKAAAFLKAVADAGSFLDSKQCFAEDPSDEEDEDEEENNPNPVDAEETTPAEPSDNSTTQIIEPEGKSQTSSESSSRSSSMGPPSLTKFRKAPSVTPKDKAPRKKRKLTTEYVRETLSFLDEDDNAANGKDELWQPSRTLGDAIEDTQLISDDEDLDTEMLDLEKDSMLGKPGNNNLVKLATKNASITTGRVVNRRLERRSLIAHSGSMKRTSTNSIISDERLDVIDITSIENDDDDDDEIVFKGSSFSLSSSFRSTSSFQKASSSNLGNGSMGTSDNNGMASTSEGSGSSSSVNGFTAVKIGSGSTGVSSKASINYQQKRKLVGLKRTNNGALSAQDVANKVKTDAVNKAIKQRQRSSLYSQGSWE